MPVLIETAGVEGMLKIAVCDNDRVAGAYLEKLTKQCVEAQVSVFYDGEGLIRDSADYDIILLDISLSDDGGGLNGVEVARKIREKSETIIIFVTALREYVFEGYDVGAFNYLLKPIDENKFREVLEKAVRRVRREKSDDALIIKVDGGYVSVPVKNITYAENEARKIVLHTKNMSVDSYTFYEKMDALESRLGDDFFRSHRGFLVNLAEVGRYDNSNIELKNGDKVYMSKVKYNDFVAAYMAYLRRT